MKITRVELDHDAGQRGNRRVSQWYFEGNIPIDDLQIIMRVKLKSPKLDIHHYAFSITYIELEKEYTITKAHH
jgi:hypothetical protein